MTRHPRPNRPAAEIPLGGRGGLGDLPAPVSGVRLVLVSSLLQTAIAPLLPSYAHRFHLSGFETAALLAATGVAALAVSVPAGSLADRFGARGLTLSAGWLIAVATIGQAFAPSYEVLLAARLVFGLGYGVVWTAGLAWLANASHDESALAGTVTVSGLGSIVGPAFAGFIAEWFGLAAPFVVAAVLVTILTVMLTSIDIEGAPSAERISRRRLELAHRSGRRQGAGSNDSRRRRRRDLRPHDACSSRWSCTRPAPPRLRSGSRSRPPPCCSSSAALPQAGSGQRAVRLRTVLAAALILALALSPATVSTAPLSIVVMLCATAGLRSVLWTVGYPLGATGANRAGVGLGVVMGLLNGVWALTAVVSPLVAGALVGSVRRSGDVRHNPALL